MNLLFPTDFSEHSSNAKVFAADIVRRSEGKLSLLNVYLEPIVSPATDYFTSDDVDVNHMSDDVHDVSMEDLKSILKEFNFEPEIHQCHVRAGDVEKEILKVIESDSIELVVMGTRGHSNDPLFLMGSTTRDIALHAHCPVLAIPPKAHFRPLKKIVYAVDLYDDETYVIGKLLNFAEIYDSDITLLHVNLNAEKPHWDVDSLISLVESFSNKNVFYDEVEADNIEEGILEYTRKNETDLLAITTKTISFFDNLVHDSLTRKLIHDSNLPLMIFKRESFQSFFFG